MNPWSVTIFADSFSVQSLPFYSLNSITWWTEVLNFSVIKFVLFSLVISVFCILFKNFFSFIGNIFSGIFLKFCSFAFQTDVCNPPDTDFYVSVIYQWTLRNFFAHNHITYKLWQFYFLLSSPYNFNVFS